MNVFTIFYTISHRLTARGATIVKLENARNEVWLAVLGGSLSRRTCANFFAGSFPGPQS